MSALIKKIAKLNEATLQLIAEQDNISIIRSFTDESIKLLDADFGFAVGRFSGNSNYPYQLVYKSSNTPFEPAVTEKNKTIYKSDMAKHCKVSLNIPIQYGDHVYGSIIVCYKNKHKITEENLTLAQIIGPRIAHVITINWLIENEHLALEMAEKQKEIQVLLDQEKLKNEFLANATHEFRTPLAIIRGTADLALRTKKNKAEESENALRQINKEVANLANIISELVLLIFSDDKSKNSLNFVPINVIEVINESIKRLSVLLKAKNITLNTKGFKDKIIINGDRINLDRLFINIIRNAITYGKQNGSISINIKNSDGKVIIEIKDSGIGITQEELPHIFDRFFRTKKAKEISGIGTGLGLAIVKWVVETHSGKIEVKSKEDVGTTFTITLPVLPGYKAS